MSKLGLGETHQKLRRIIEALSIKDLRKIQPLTQQQIIASIEHGDPDLELFGNSTWLPAHTDLTHMLADFMIDEVDPRHWHLEDTVALLKTVALYYSFDYPGGRNDKIY